MGNFVSQRVDHLEIRASGLLDGSLRRGYAGEVWQVSERLSHFLTRARELQYAIEIGLRDGDCARQQERDDCSSHFDSPASKYK